MKNVTNCSRTAQKEIETLPALPSPRIKRLLGEAAGLLASRQYRQAHALCLEVLAEDPETAEAYFLLGLLTADHANPAKASDLFARAISIAPGHAAALAQQARCLIALSRREDAIGAARRAAALRPEDAFTLDTIGVVFSRAGLHAEAVAFYAAATRAAPGRADYHYNHGAALQFIGEMDAARAAYAACLAIDPHETRALSSIVQITRQSAAVNAVAQLQTVFEAVKENADDALRIGHALAKACEDLGHPDAALAWLDKAKAGKRLAVRHDRAADDQLFAAAIRSAERFGPRDAGPDAAPVFIVGMPRTGTTLVDRILSSHSQVTSAGELTDFALALKRQAATPSPLVLDAATIDAAAGLDLSAVGAAYLASVERTLGLTGRFIDKMPLNAMLSAVILGALPGARVICLRRHPADTVLSNYRQMFATSFSYYTYAYTLEDTAHYYAGFDRMVRALAARLPPDRFTEVHYERIVADIEGETRRLLDFCGLAFEAACVNFHENTAPVATASAAQVREPLYTSALARWKRYKRGLKPALDVLDAAGCLEPGSHGA